MSRDNLTSGLQKTMPIGQTLNKDDYDLDLDNAFQAVGGARRELEILHLQRRVILTFTYLRMLQELTARGVIDGDKAQISVTGMSLQMRSGSDGKEEAHQIMGELHSDGQPLYGYWGENGITQTERRALGFLTAGTSGIPREFNKIDIMIERNGRMAYGDLAREVVKNAGTMTPSMIFDGVLAVFKEACATSLAGLPTTNNVFHRRKKGADDTALSKQMLEDQKEATAMLTRYIKRLNNFGVVGRAFTSRSLESLMEEIEAKAYPGS